MVIFCVPVSGSLAALKEYCMLSGLSNNFYLFLLGAGSLRSDHLTALLGANNGPFGRQMAAFLLCPHIAERELLPLLIRPLILS
jgi:hypothetical protein